MNSFLLALELYPVLLLALVGILGLIVGSFLNVVIYRLPVMMEREWTAECRECLADELPKSKEPAPESFNLMRPRSRCPKCGHQITALENIPVVSWLVQKGKCTSCHTSISSRYPAIEAITALLSIAVAIYVPFGWPLILALVFTWALIALTFIDLDTMLLPDQITLPLLWLGLLFNLSGGFASIESAVIGATAGYLSLWSLYWAFKLLTGKDGMGYGDFKLLAVLGAWFGWQSLPLILLFSSLAGAILGVSMILLAKTKKGQAIPFGPYLAIAGWVYLIWGDTLTTLYFNALA